MLHLHRYGFRKLSAFERACSVLMEADLEEAVVALDNSESAT